LHRREGIGAGPVSLTAAPDSQPTTRERTITEQLITQQSAAEGNERRPAICLSGLSKNYGAASVLQDVAMEVRRGALFGLVGANGAGKTTLIKCLLDFCDFDAGHIEIFGVPSTRTSARSRLAFLPERFVPPYYLTGEDFLRFMLRMYRRPYDTAAAVTMFDVLDLPREAMRKPVRAFSKGMTQKLGLAACLLSKRELLVLDEPTSGLDPKARALVKAQLTDMRKGGATLFLTSHSLADVEELCSEMAVLDRGRLRFMGSPEDLMRRHGAANLEQAYLACIA
jgi:ABC-2 type transport system ATP-binding protein